MNNTTLNTHKKDNRQTKNTKLDYYTQIDTILKSTLTQDISVLFNVVKEKQCSSFYLYVYYKTQSKKNFINYINLHHIFNFLDIIKIIDYITTNNLQNFETCKTKLTNICCKQNIFYRRFYINILLNSILHRITKHKYLIKQHLDCLKEQILLDLYNCNSLIYNELHNKTDIEYYNSLSTHYSNFMSNFDARTVKKEIKVNKKLENIQIQTIKKQKTNKVEQIEIQKVKRILQKYTNNTNITEEDKRILQKIKQRERCRKYYIKKRKEENKTYKSYKYNKTIETLLKQHNIHV